MTEREAMKRQIDATREENRRLRKIVADVAVMIEERREAEGYGADIISYRAKEISA